MRKMSIGLCLLALAVAIGCSGSSPEGEEAAKPDKADKAEPKVAKTPDEAERTVAMKPVPGETEQTFSLSVPFESLTLEQGEEQSFRIGINRGENFREEVEIELSGLPEGVTVVETEDPVIDPGSTGVTLTLQAAGDAALGDFTFKVMGHTASSGEDFSKEMNITIAQSSGSETLKE